jgi:PAS domain S-box-containing protein
MPVRDIRAVEAGASQEDGAELSPTQTLGMLVQAGNASTTSSTSPGIEDLHRATFGLLPLGVSYANREGSFIWCNQAYEQMLGLAAGEISRISIREFIHPDDRPASGQRLADLWEGRTSSYSLEMRFVRRDGTVMWGHLTTSMVRTHEGAPVCSIGFLQDITPRKQMEAQVERVQKQLLDASRQAGMAEVATNVLHNVGNVLNSVNVSASLVADRIKTGKGPRLAEVAKLVEQHSADLPRFFGEDERGRKLPGYLRALAGQLTGERDRLLNEMANLRANIDHIREAVSMQQTYARRCGVLETVNVVDLVEDSVRMNSGALTRHHVALERDYRAQPDVMVDRHQVLQILVNLIRNAKHACDESGRADKKVTVRVESVAEGASIKVMDNGVGIAPENMERLFTHGFTTRKAGHGFGLHSASLAAAELGGKLTAKSDGAGQGATFQLTLPLQPPGKGK